MAFSARCCTRIYGSENFQGISCLCSSNLDHHHGEWIIAMVRYFSYAKLPQVHLSVIPPFCLVQGHLVCGYVYVMYSEQIHPISWTIPHCVLVLKLIGELVTRWAGCWDAKKVK